jgi:hypothetical protein
MTMKKAAGKRKAGKARAKKKAAGAKPAKKALSSVARMIAIKKKAAKKTSPYFPSDFVTIPGRGGVRTEVVKPADEYFPEDTKIGHGGGGVRPARKGIETK